MPTGEVALVVNFDMPKQLDDYARRSAGPLSNQESSRSRVELAGGGPRVSLVWSGRGGWPDRPATAGPLQA